MLGFRFDRGRDAYVLRLVGGRFGPVLRDLPRDSAAEAMDWPEQMQEREEQRVAERRRAGRFTREADRPAADRREHPVRH